MAGSRGILLVGSVVVALALPSVSAAATITVTRAADELDAVPDAKCSLREAVQSANTNAAVGGCPKGTNARDTIRLDEEVYSLTIPTTDEAMNANGDLDVLAGGPVTIRGEGPSASRIGTSLLDRVIDLKSASGDLTLERLSVNGGDVVGFGTASGRGGNIRAELGGALALDRVTVVNGAAYVGGGLYMAQPGTLKISRSNFTLNDATGLAGALDTVNGVAAKIAKSEFAANTVTDATGTAEAGAISNRGASMKITDTAITDNQAIGAPMQGAYGGALSNASGSALTVKRSYVAGNSASTPTDNVVESAGGIFTSSGGASVLIANSTFYDNSAGSPDGLGGALNVNSGTTVVANVTFLDNTAGEGGDDVATSAGYLLLRNSILPGADPCTGAQIDSGGYNVAALDDFECDFHPTDVTDASSFGFKTTAPLDNGGATPTLALRKSSPAVDLVPEASCVVAKREDQRDYRRPGRGSGLCDSGSYERRAKP